MTEKVENPAWATDQALAALRDMAGVWVSVWLDAVKAGMPAAEATKLVVGVAGEFFRAYRTPSA